MNEVRTPSLWGADDRIHGESDVSGRLDCSCELGWLLPFWNGECQRPFLSCFLPLYSDRFEDSESSI